MNMSFRFEGGEGEKTVTIPVSYIPNYIVEIDGERVPVFKNTDRGTVSFNTDKSEGNVRIRYSEPTTFRACEAVSLISIIGAAILCLREKKKNG